MSREIRKVFLIIEKEHLAFGNEQTDRVVVIRPVREGPAGKAAGKPHKSKGK